MRMKSFVPPSTTLLFCAIMPVCDEMSSSLNRELEEEKSCTRHAMEYHRQHPENRPGDAVLQAWSTAGYIAQAVVDQKSPGDWTHYTDQLLFLQSSLQQDLAGRPFCIVRRGGEIVVIRYVAETQTPGCTLQSTGNVNTAKIRCGDMEFSGRADSWTYSPRVQSGR
jgi:hypothetical protein